MWTSIIFLAMGYVLYLFAVNTLQMSVSPASNLVNGRP